MSRSNGLSTEAPGAAPAFVSGRATAAKGRTAPKAEPSEASGSAADPDIFGRLTGDECALLLSCAKEQHLKPGTELFVQGCKHTATYVIKSGLVRTYYVSPLGREVTMAFWSRGNLVGGPDFFTPDARHVWSGRVVEPSVILVIKSSDLRELCARIPSLAASITDALSFKLRWTSLLLQMMATESVQCRLARLLLMLSEVYGAPQEGEVAIKYNFTQEDLANMVGATRQWVSVMLGKLQRSRIIAIRKRRIFICDRTGLEQLAECGNGPFVPAA